MGNQDESSINQVKKYRSWTGNFSVGFLSVHPGKVISSKKNHPDDVLHIFLPEIGRENRGKIP